MTNVNATKTKCTFIAHHRESDGQEQSVAEHLCGVAGYAEKFAAKLQLGKCGRLIGLVHDLGKYSTDFQSYLRSGVGLLNPDEDAYVDAGALKGKIDHSTAGAQLIWQHLSSRGPIASLMGQILSLSVASHHSGLRDCLAPNGLDNFSRRMGKSTDKTHLDEAWSAVDK